MSPHEGTGFTQVGPTIIYKKVKGIKVWKLKEDVGGREIAKMRLEFGPGSNSEFPISLHIYDDLLKVEQDLRRLNIGPRAVLA